MAVAVKRRFGPESLRIWQVIVVGAAILAALLTGLGVAFQPALVVLPLVPLVGLALLFSAPFRLAFVLFGGLLVLQSSSGFDVQKIAYLAGCMVAFGIAFLRSRAFESSPANAFIGFLKRFSLVWMLVIAVSLPVALIQGILPVNWIRDVIPYLLIAAVPFLAFDFLITVQIKPHSITPSLIFLAFSALSTLSFSSTWIIRRGYADIPYGDLLFSSFIVPCALFCYAFAQAISGKSSRWVWSTIAVVVLVLFLITGTRTSFVMPIAAVGVVLWGGFSGLKRVPRVISLAVFAAVVGWLLLSTIPQLLGLDTNILVDRILSVTEIVSDSAGGQSLDERSIQSELTLDVFRNHLLFGIGPGYLYEWNVPWSSAAKYAFVIDSPFSIPAKFGLFGVFAFGMTLLVLHKFQSLLARVDERAIPERDTVRGFLLIILLLSLLSSPIEDKGFSFALVLVLIVCLRPILRDERERSI